MTRIAIVAGEPSGDLLGGGLVEALRQRIPDAEFFGIAGPRMQAAGAESLYPMERLSVMGLVEVLGRLPELLRMRRQLAARIVAARPDVFIGIDAPDFNLGLERRLRQAGIRTVHYVSPSVWAWRQGRVKKIARAVDLILTLFPFEEPFYAERGVRARCVGHPLADQIPLAGIDGAAARAALGLPAQGRVLALLPGSRVGELARHAALYAQTARWCAERMPDLRFVAPFATHATRTAFETAWAEHAPGLPLICVDGHADQAMAAADAVLLASGTATLEALLLKRPMVVAHRVAPLTHWLMIRGGLLKSAYVSLPNLLAGRELVPELLQDAATPERLGGALLDLLEQGGDAAQREAFVEIHRSLRRDASNAAAAAIAELLGR